MSGHRAGGPYQVEPMTLDDLDAVMAIEEIAHSSPWPASAYRHELEQNELSHYLVVLPEGHEHASFATMRERLASWLRLGHRGRPIVGYGGFWMMVGEAHISTIAIHPQWRGLGLGELVLLSLIEEALRQAATLVTLEVRVSNEAAQKLYEKYRFAYVGQRKRYYRDNQEDAHIMTVEGVQDPAYRAFLDERWGRLATRLGERAGSEAGNA